MSTEQHEALELAQDLATCGATSADVAAAVQAIRTQHALIVQMAESLDWVAKIHKDPTLAQERDPELWLPAADEAIAAATQYLTRGPKT